MKIPKWKIIESKPDTQEGYPGILRTIEFVGVKEKLKVFGPEKMSDEEIQSAVRYAWDKRPGAETKSHEDQPEV